jgi:hypothetical protein
MQNPLKAILGTCRRGAMRLRARSRGIYSNFEEQLVIEKHLRDLNVATRFCVDIAAGDGISMSNTYALFRQGWNGLAVEYDAQRFAKLARAYEGFKEVYLAKCMVTPPNVLDLLKGNQVPKQFGFLNLDIDGYDFYVLEQILKEFRPALICAEINEKIPTPVKFTVKWSPDYGWRGDHFYGQSLSQLCSLCPAFGYSLVEVHYNNAFLVPSELKPAITLEPAEAYRKGYVEQPDRQLRMPWNADMEPLLTMSPEEAVAFINHRFADRAGQYICGL